MPKKFCVTGICIPEKNYMVDISKRIDTIMHDYIENGQCFTINRARQYGKTTTLYLLERRLQKEYLVLSLSFEAVDEYFETQLYDMFLAELAVNNKLYMEIMIRNLWKRMDENYFYYFNKKKKTGIQELNYNGKKILEVVV